MNPALDQWIAMLANHRVQHNGKTPEQARTWVRDQVEAQRDVYRGQGAPYGDDDDGLLRWLIEDAQRSGQI